MTPIPQRAQMIVTADFHIDFLDNSTAENFVEAVSRRQPRLFVVAGDLGHGPQFERALAVLSRVECEERALIIGNHDLWCRGFWPPSATSEYLFRNRYPRMASEASWTWLEDSTLRIESTAVVGTSAWYDYSANEDPKADAEMIHALKGNYNNDARYMDRRWDDRRIAAECLTGLVQRLEFLECDKTVSRVVVVTHLPIFREQRVSHPADDPMANAYFYNYTIGEAVMKYRKVTDVVSGHTHRGVTCEIAREDAPAINASVIDADYGRPCFFEVTV